VLHQLLDVRALEVAGGALVGLLTGVGPLVDDQVVLEAELLVAVAAGIAIGRLLEQHIGGL